MPASQADQGDSDPSRTLGVMRALPAYHRDPYARGMETAVERSEQWDGAPCVILHDTLLYPEGGGQPADHGWINGVAVRQVVKDGDLIRHLLDEPVPCGPAVVELDWHRRFDHMQQHTAQHLLTALAQDRLGWATTAFHLGEIVSDIELQVSDPTLATLEQLSEMATTVIREARPVAVRWVTRDEAKELGPRTRGLPEGLSGPLRLVEITGLDCTTCGGTHVSCTAELETIALVGQEPMRGGTRVYFIAGGRVRRRLAEHEVRSGQLRTLLGAPDHQLPDVVKTKLAQLHLMELRLRRTEDELCRLTALEMLRTPSPLLDAHYPDRDGTFLQRLARSLAEAESAPWALLTASDHHTHTFVLVAPAESAALLARMGREVAAALGGRGGGVERVFQGKAPDLHGRDKALAILRSIAGGPSSAGSG